MPPGQSLISVRLQPRRRHRAARSRCKAEDTPEAHLETTVRAFLRLVDKTLAHVAGG